HVGLVPGAVGPMHGIPAGGRETVAAQQFHVLAPAAAVVEEGVGLLDQAVAQGALDRPGEIASPDGGLVSGDGRAVLHKWKGVVRTHAGPTPAACLPAAR